MKIVQICPTPFPSLGGPALNYAQFHEALNTDTICFVRPGEGVGEHSVVPAEINVRTVGFPLLRRYYYAEPAELKTAEASVATADCLIIHNFYRFPAEWGCRVAQRYGVPYILVLHGILDPWVFNKNGLLKRIWLQFYGAKILERANVVLCATERERSKITHFLRNDSGKVVNWAAAIPPPVAGAPARAVLRAKLGYGPSDRVLIYFGRLDSMKRPREMVELLAGIGDPRLKLLVVGPDADVTKAQLERLAKKLDWQGLQVVGPCFSDEKYGYLRAADAYISLSHRENFNFTAAEAMLSGLALILSAGNDLGWEFADQGASWQLRTDDPAEAIAAVRSFIHASDADLRRMGAVATQWAATNLNVHRFKEGIDAVVRDCISQKRKAG